MSYFKKAIDEILIGVREALNKVNMDDVMKMIRMIIDSKDRKILVIGAGRSGFVGKAFALRLMHLGFNVFVAGETITPALSREDLVIAISGSGTTRTVITQAEVAKEIGARVVAITSYSDSPLGKLSDHVVIVKGRTKIAEERDYLARQMLGLHEPLAPLGTLFEISAMVFLDSVIAELMVRLGKTEEEMRRRHAVIE